MNINHVWLIPVSAKKQKTGSEKPKNSISNSLKLEMQIISLHD